MMLGLDGVRAGSSATPPVLMEVGLHARANTGAQRLFAAFNTVLPYHFLSRLLPIDWMAL